MRPLWRRISGPSPARDRGPRAVDPTAFAALVEGTLRGDEVTGTALAARRRSDGLTLMHGAGDMTPDTPFFGASITKLYITALLLQLREEGRLDLDAPLGRWLPADRIAGLNVQDRVDLTGRITLRMLMRQTSGIADYFQHRVDGISLEQRLMAGYATPYSTDDTLAWSREMGAHYPPGTGSRAVYSDTNYQLQGLIVEAVEDRPLAEVLQSRLFAPLGLERTWLHADPADHRAILPRYRDRPLDIRRVAVSFWADGGMVTTACDGLTFLDAFFGGRLFPEDRLAPLYDWRKMFFPLSYGTGIERMHLPRVMTGLRRGPELFGKAGLTGAFLFADLAAGVSMAGSVNQVHDSGRSFRLMFRTVGLMG